MTDIPPYVYTVEKQGRTYHYVRVQTAGRRAQAPLTNAWLVSQGGRATHDPAARAAAIRAILIRRLERAGTSWQSRRLTVRDAADRFMLWMADQPHGKALGANVQMRRRSVLIEPYRQPSRRASSRLSLVEFLGPGRKVQDITPDDILAFERHLSDTGRYRAESLRAYMRDVKRFFSWCADQELIRRSPARAAKYRLPEAEEPKHHLSSYTPAEMATMETVLRHGCPRLHRLLIVIGQTGMRLGEYLRIREEHLHEGFITVPGARKNVKRRTAWRNLPLTPALRLYLATVALPAGAYLASGTPTPMPVWRVRLDRQQLEGHSGIRLVPQKLRRTYGQRLIDAGCSEDLICRRMGNTPAVLRRHYVLPPSQPLSDLEERALAMP